MPENEVGMPDQPIERKRKIWPWMLVVLLVVGMALATIAVLQIYRNVTAPKPTPTVKVGVLAAFTGGSSSMGYGIMKGVQVAKKQLGASTIEIVQADSQCDPNMAREAMKRLLEQKVVAVIGDGCSSASVAVLPQANNGKAVMISPSASSTALSIPNDYFFRVIPSDSFQAGYIAEAILARGIKKVAVFYTNEPYGANMNVAFQEKYQSLGGQVVATAYGEPDDIDLGAQMKLLKDAKPDGVFIAPNSAVSATGAARMARQVGISSPLFGADIFYDQTIITNAPAATDGLTITSFPTGSASFKQTLLNEYKVNEQLYAAPQAYDAFEAIFRAVQGGASTGEAIKEALASVRFDGVSARIEFDQNGEIAGKEYKYDVLQIKNGEFTKVE
jgi:branched-chain amino acid transport system substrate-binding protein